MERGRGINILSKHFLGYLFVSVMFIVGSHGISMAVPYTLSGTAGWPATGQYQVNGILDIGENPNIYDLGYPDGPKYTVDFKIAYTFYIANETFTGSGMMRIRDSAGLFDAQFYNPAYSSTGERYTWEALDATFFYPNGTAYPSWWENSLAYSEHPARIDFFGSRLFSETHYSSFSISELSATRIQASVPEPAILLLFGSGVIGFIGFRRRKFMSN